MEDDKFAWRDQKAARNARDHDVTFAIACAVFNDPFAVEWQDTRFEYGEDRYSIVGMVENRLLHVAYTIRGEKIRMISARRATPHERRLYHEENRD